MSTSAATLAVLLPLPLTSAYDYLPGIDPVTKGSIVEVPIGRKLSYGAVWGEGSGDVPPARLKPILRVLDLPPLPAVTGFLSTGSLSTR